MEQVASLPSYMYIPAPIQQQIAGYQKGKLLEVYKWGWRRDKRTTMTAVLMLLVMLPIGIVSAIGLGYMLINAVYLNIGIIVLVLLVSSIGLYTAATAASTIKNGSICICAYDNGLIYAKNTHITWLLWSECVSLKQQTKRNRTQGTLCIFTLRTHDGRIFRFGGPFLAVDDLGKIIRGKIAH